MPSRVCNRVNRVTICEHLVSGSRHPLDSYMEIVFNFFFVCYYCELLLIRAPCSVKSSSYLQRRSSIVMVAPAFGR